MDYVPHGWTSKLGSALAVFLAFASSAAADDIANCFSIKVDRQRLLCYDKEARALIEVRRKAEEERQRAEAEKPVKGIDPLGISPEQKVRAESAIKQLNKLFAATEVGISYRDYGSRIVDISAEFKESVKALPESDLRTELELSLFHHIAAREMWNGMITSQYAEVFEKVYCPSLIETYKFVPCNVSGDYNARLRTSRVSDTSKSQVLTAVWKVSRVHMARAEEMLSRGKLGGLEKLPQDVPQAPALSPADLLEAKRIESEAAKHRATLKAWEEGQRK